MNRYFVWLEGKREHGKVIVAESSFAARKVCAAVTPGRDVTDFCARRLFAGAPSNEES